MRKLLHLVYAIWKTGKPFDAKHYPWISRWASAWPIGRIKILIAFNTPPGALASQTSAKPPLPRRLINVKSRNLKAWWALWPTESPGRWRERHRQDKDKVLRMEFKTFVNAF